MVTLRWRRLADTDMTRWLRLTLPRVRLTRLPMWCSEKSTNDISPEFGQDTWGWLKKWKPRFFKTWKTGKSKWSSEERKENDNEMLPVCSGWDSSPEKEKTLLWRLVRFRLRAGWLYSCTTAGFLIWRAACWPFRSTSLFWGKIQWRLEDNGPSHLQLVFKRFRKRSMWWVFTYIQKRKRSELLTNVVKC